MAFTEKEILDTLSDLAIIHASTDTNYFNTSLEQGKLIHVISLPVITMSLPEQTSGIVIY